MDNKLDARKVRTKARQGEFNERVNNLYEMLCGMETERERLGELKAVSEENGVKLTPTLQRAVDDACKAVDLALLHCRVFCFELKTETKEGDND